jgi:Lon protease-like protein
VVKLHASDLPASIPVFPLTGALLLPHTRLPLNIFEPRYLAMIEDCLKTDHRLIGMIQPRSNPVDGAAETLHHIGCAGRLTRFSEAGDGRYLVTLTGISRFRLIEQIEGFTPYIKGGVDWGSFGTDLVDTDKDTTFDRPAFLELLGRYFEFAGLTSDWDALKDADEANLINTLSMLCPFPSEEKQALLEAPDLRIRRETLTSLIQFAMMGDGEQGKLQ